MHTVSKKVDEKAHRAVRKHIKQTLQTMDLDDPSVIDIEGDTRTLGHEEWGTKFGFDVSEILSEEDELEWQKLSRK